MAASDDTAITYKTSTSTVLILLFCLVALVLLLVFLYIKLNKEANGKYTIQRIVYRQGGIRDRVRGAVLSLEPRLGVQLWPRGETDDGEEHGEEMQEVRVEEAQVEEGGSQQSYSEGEEEERDGEDLVKTSGKGGDTSDENSSLEGSEAGEQARPTDHEPEVKGGMAEGGEEWEKKAEASGGGGGGGCGLLVDLKQFSGSATWSEEGGAVCTDSDVTAL